MNVADVWVNGVKKTRHLGGYLPFVIDFTDEAVPDSLNHVIVRLDNTDNPITGPKPLKQLDYNTYGGLYRDVFLIMENTVFITDPIFENRPGSGGIFVSYPGVSREKAVIRVQTHVKNTGDGDQDIVISHIILKGNDVILKYESPGRELKAKSDAEFVEDITLPSPDLWSPASPNLYKLVTHVSTGNRLLDTDTTRIGIRRFDIRQDHFSINGEEMFLRGVNRHQEYPYIGYALSNEAQYRDAQKN